MWRLILFIALVPFWAHSADIRVTTWNLEWFPSGSPNLATPEIEAKRIADAAAVLKQINPDVLLLQEIRDQETCEKLVSALKPETYHVLICSRFKDEFGGGLGRQQVAILSKKPAFAAWSEKWKTFGIVDPPRGFAFAAIRYGTNEIGFYSVHLKSNLSRGNLEKETQINILKRELAAEQLLVHVRQVSNLLTNQMNSFVIAGDFNTNLDQDTFVSEKTLRGFGSEGFQSGFENLPLVERVTHPGKGRYPKATFDYVFVKGVSVGKPQIFSSSVSDHNPVTHIINVGLSKQ